MTIEEKSEIAFQDWEAGKDTEETRWARLVSMHAVHRYAHDGQVVQEVDGITIYADWAVEGTYRADYESAFEWAKAAWGKNGPKGIIG